MPAAAAAAALSGAMMLVAALNPDRRPVPRYHAPVVHHVAAHHAPRTLHVRNGAR